MKRIKVRPTKKNRGKFANTARRVNKRNVEVTTKRGGIRL